MIENNLKQRATLVPIESKSQGWNNTYKRGGTNNVYNNTLLEGEKKMQDKRNSQAKIE